MITVIGRAFRRDLERKAGPGANSPSSSSVPKALVTGEAPAARTGAAPFAPPARALTSRAASPLGSGAMMTVAGSGLVSAAHRAVWVDSYPSTLRRYASSPPVLRIARPTWRQPQKTMTIAAGFVCRDGLLFASDTLHSGVTDSYRSVRAVTSIAFSGTCGEYVGPD
jgi:hypothetical protein